MRPLQGFVWSFALALVAVCGNSAQAAWNNVFQVCCNHCKGSAPAVANYGDPCPTPCAPPPTTTCTTRYVQRCYYQPVTSYRTSTYYEPVTSYRTSYYYEPTTCYRYSCYYDPCTCSYQSVATPVTSYRLRSRCCPVTSYLQRTCMTPVTTYQQSFYYEPVTSCCTTGGGAPVTNTPMATPTPANPSDGMNGDGYPGGTSPTTPGRLNPVERTEPDPSMPSASRNSGGSRTPKLRVDRTASRSTPNVEGQVVDSYSAGQSGVKILLVSAESRKDQQTVTADRDGGFRANLASGGWLIYTYEKGKPVFARRIEVANDRLVSLTLVSR